MKLGATYLDDGQCQFLVWAPRARQVELNLVAPTSLCIPMKKLEGGYFFLEMADIGPGARYFYRLNREYDRPDPASRFQPEGVHGPSELVDQRFTWSDADWRGLPLDQHIIYELHVGTFTPEGTFAGVAARLDELQRLGITAIQLMPVAQFPGTRNWGYDGAYPFAVQNSYGGPLGLKQLVDACHARSLAILMDVVYNHLGPEGNYLGSFGPYFTDRYRNPWGDALNFDGLDSDEVRRYFIENAIAWVRDYHVDGLRLDAVHAIHDQSAHPFLQELAQAVHGLGRQVHVIEESNQNDSRSLQPPEIGGWGMDGVWNDDFHHAVHALLTGENQGYYADFGTLEHLAKTYREGFAYTGEYSQFRRRRHGASANGIAAKRFVVSTQTHDHVGNRPEGDRLSRLVSFEQLKLAAGLMLLSPYLPMLFMGEEYGETAPFLYFVSHGDSNLIEAVRRGRQEEFADWNWPQDVPDPQSEEAFGRSRLNQDLLDERSNRLLWNYYRELIRLRKTIPALAHLDKEQMRVEAWETSHTLQVERWQEASRACILFNLARQPQQIVGPLPEEKWVRVLDSAATEWDGPGGSRTKPIESSAMAQWELPPASLVLLAHDNSFH